MPRLKQMAGQLFGMVLAFGLGYGSTRSTHQHLKTLALASNGIFFFIRDDDMVPKTIALAESHVRSIFAVRARVQIDGNPGNPLACFPISQVTPGIEVQIPPLRIGQNFDMFFPSTFMSRAKILFELLDGRVITINTEFDAHGPENAREYIYHYARSRVSSWLHEVVSQDLDNPLLFAKSVYDKFFKPQIGFPQPNPSELEHIGLKHDLNAGVTESLKDKQSFDSWGCHYLFSLAMAHGRQFRHNHDDEGVMRYGGPIFHNLYREMTQLITQ